MHKLFGSLVADPALQGWSIVDALILKTMTHHTTQRGGPAFDRVSLEGKNSRYGRKPRLTP